MCRGSYTPVISHRMTLDPLLPALQQPSYVVELDKAYAKPGSNMSKISKPSPEIGYRRGSVEPDRRRSQPGIIVTDLSNGHIQYIDQFPEAKLELQPKLASIEHRKLERSKASPEHIKLSPKLDHGQTVLEAVVREPEKSPVYKRSKRLLSRKSEDSSGVTPRGYKAVNVRAVGRTSEAFAQCINLKEDKRLVARLTSLDREMTVFSNSVTRDEKVLLQRSRALANVMSKRELKRGRSCERSRTETQESSQGQGGTGGANFLYGVKIVRWVEELEVKKRQDRKKGVLFQEQGVTPFPKLVPYHC